MGESRRYEAERSAWIKSKRWIDKAAAARRSELLARRARQLDRSAAGLGSSALSEGVTRGPFARFTQHEDSKASALGFAAYVIVYCIVIPLWFGVAAALAWLCHRGGEVFAETVRPRVWPYFASTATASVVFIVSRPLGLDIWLIHVLARFLEAATGGWLAPAALSRWYAAGWVSWIEIQVVLGLALGGWRTYAWGWSAPAVRREARGRTANSDRGVRIISDARVRPISTTTTASTPVRADTTTHDPIRIISGGDAA